MQKLIKRTRNKRSGWLYLTNNFYKMYLEIQYKSQGHHMYFSSDFGWYSIQFDIVC